MDMYQTLKARHRAERDNYPINLSLRVHRGSVGSIMPSSIAKRMQTAPLFFTGLPLTLPMVLM
ncbi:MAG: hypothetical protein LRY40_00715 [Shewanella fodinae]|nr:hypothetical protein [Shewanella fodinae]